MKKTKTKLIFKENKLILKEDPEDELYTGLQNIGKDIVNVGKVAVNSFKVMMANLKYTYEIGKAIYKGESLREVHLTHARKLRQLKKDGDAIVNSMSGASDMKSFISIFPGIAAGNFLMENSHILGEKVEDLNTAGRKEWNGFVKEIYSVKGKEVPSKLLFDVGDEIRQDNKISALNGIVLIFKMLLGEKNTKSLNTIKSSQASKPVIRRVTTSIQNIRKIIQKNNENQKLEKLFIANEKFFIELLGQDRFNLLLKLLFDTSDIEKVFEENKKNISYFEEIGSILKSSKEKTEEFIKAFEKLAGKELKDKSSKDDSDKDKSDDEKAKKEPDNEKAEKEPDDEKAEKETLNSGIKLIFKNNKLFLTENESDKEESTEQNINVILSKEVSNMFISSYFLNNFYAVMNVLIQERVNSVYFTFINEILNCHNDFINNASVKVDPVNTSYTSLNEYYKSIDDNIAFVEETLNNKIFEMIAEAKLSELSSEEYKKELDGVKSYYAAIKDEIANIKNSIVKNIEKSLSDKQKLNNENSDKLIVIPIVKALADNSGGFVKEFNQLKKEIPEIINALNSDNLINEILQNINSDFEWYQNNDYTKNFVNKENIQNVTSGLNSLDAIYDAINEQDMNSVVSTLKERISEYAKELEEEIKPQEQTVDNNTTNDSDDVKDDEESSNDDEEKEK